MRHLDEEQLIDALMGEPLADELRRHLATCAECHEQLETLELGLSAARSVKPRMPLAPVPVISYNKFDRHRKQTRLMWIGIAAMFFLAVVGLRFNISSQGLTIQFALFHSEKGSNVDEARIAAMEQRIYAAIETQSVLAQNQIDARFNAFMVDQDQQMGEFSSVVNQNLNQTSLENAQKMLAMEKEFLRQSNRNQVRGQMR